MPSMPRHLWRPGRWMSQATSSDPVVARHEARRPLIGSAQDSSNKGRSADHTDRHSAWTRDLSAMPVRSSLTAVRLQSVHPGSAIAGRLARE
jgi:hypothetical protein